MRKRIFILIFISIIFGILAAFSTLSKPSDAQIIDESTVDTITYNDYSNIISEKRIGEVWTDKSVTDTNMKIGSQTIIKSSDEAFLSSLSAFSVGLDLNIKEGNVKDIIILQDLSTSMSSTVTSSSGTITRLQASKNAINSLLEVISNVNDSLSSDDEKFHVSLVAFSTAGSEKVIFNLTEVNKNNLATLQANVNAMALIGNTYIANGLDLCLNQIQTYGRGNVDSCIISFLDGVASDSDTAIAKANTLKNIYGVIMYSIILNDEAIGGTSTAIDSLGQGLSSNYDHATNTTSLGTQTGNSYYYIPSNADDLIDSFEKIIKAIQRKIYTIENGSSLVFEDTLSDYMTVKRIKTIIYDGIAYDNVSSSVSGTKTTYKFSGNVIDSTGSLTNLNQIVIEVTRSNIARTGDIIKVTIPSNLVPLAVYDVTSTFLTSSTVYTTVLENTSPISIVYSSNIKEEAYELYKNNDPTIERYVEDNGYVVNYEGYAYFYESYYSSGANGTTSVSFTPYYANDYYYYTEDTYLYTKSGNNYTLYTGTSLPSGTYYIKKTIYNVGNKIASTEYYEAVASTSGAQRDSKNNWYFASGNKKTISSTNSKASNLTNTASNSKSTNWSSSKIVSLFGNNGRALIHMEIDKIDLSITKAWDDSNNQDGKRPSDVTIELFANGNSLGEDYIIHLNDANNWTYTYEGLPEKSGGIKISYTVEEKDVEEGYAVSVEGTMEDGYVITNSYEVEVIDIDVKKRWDDNNNQDGKRPERVVVHLKANGEALGENYDIVLNTDNKWTYTYTNLAKYENGEEIKYSIEEEVVDSYETKITGDAETGFTIINSLDPELISINVTKVWDDQNDADLVRPSLITIMLYADDVDLGEEYKITISEIDDWAYTYRSLPRYQDGHEIIYTVKEQEVAKYTTEITGSQEEGFIITNTHNIDNPTTGYKTNILILVLSIAGFIYYLLRCHRNKLYKI